MLQDVPLGQTYSQLRHYGRGVPPYFLIGSAQISRVSPEDSGGGVQTPKSPVASPLGMSVRVVLVKVTMKSRRLGSS